MKEKEYTAIVKVTREYEVGFESSNPKQALKDAETIIKDERFGDDFTDEQVQVLDIIEGKKKK